MKKLLSILLITGLIIMVACGSQSSTQNTSHKNSTTNSAVNDTFSPLKFNYLPTSTTKEIIKHTYYTVSFSDKDKQAEWVAYELTKKEASGTLSRKGYKFQTDPLVTTGSATSTDYVKSGYDRGHLASAADMEFNTTSLYECFYMSNMSPQLHSFNCGIWETLEKKVREWALEKENLYIVTAGVLTSNKGFIGKTNQITVPKYFYKIILYYQPPTTEAIAFLIPNEKLNNELTNYVVTIDSIEKLTHIHFFPSLPDSTEKRIESKIDKGNWQLK